MYTSDHGENAGARGLWGKSNHYEEAVAIPLMISSPGMAAGLCDTPVSLLDLAKTITDHFDLSLDTANGVDSLPNIAARPYDPDRTGREP